MVRLKIARTIVPFDLEAFVLKSIHICISAWMPGASSIDRRYYTLPPCCAAIMCDVLHGQGFNWAQQARRTNPQCSQQEHRTIVPRGSCELSSWHQAHQQPRQHSRRAERMHVPDTACDAAASLQGGEGSERRHRQDASTAAKLQERMGSY